MPKYSDPNQALEAFLASDDDDDDDKDDDSHGNMKMSFATSSKARHGQGKSQKSTSRNVNVFYSDSSDSDDDSDDDVVIHGATRPSSSPSSRVSSLPSMEKKKMAPIMNQTPIKQKLRKNRTRRKRIYRNQPRIFRQVN